jgi:hypothetical protein
MRKDELQYLSDTILIERLASDSELLKQAGLFEDLGFNSIAEHVKKFAKENVRADAPGGYAGSIVSLMAPAVAWRIHPILGVVTAAAQVMGFDIVSVVQSIMGGLKGKLDSGEGVDLSEVNALGKSAVAGEAGDASEANDMLLPLRQALDVRAQRWRRRGKLPKTPWGYTKGAPLLKRIFGNLGSARKGWLIGGIIVWIIKTLLVGAGLVAGAGMIKKVVTPSEEKTPVTAPAETSKPVTPKSTYKAPAPVKRPDPFTPSGNGTKYFANDADNIWIVPLINRSIDDTLVAWTVDVYPALEGREYTIEMSSAFQAAVNRLKRNFSAREPGNLIMPIGLHNRKQVVDLFSRDVKKQMKV